MVKCVFVNSLYKIRDMKKASKEFSGKFHGKKSNSSGTDFKETLDTYYSILWENLLI